MEHLPSIIEGLNAVRKAIEASKSFVERLPFFARGFAEQDFAGGTGMSYESWFKLLDSVIGGLSRLSELNKEERGKLAGDLRKLAGYLERYAQYLEAIPGKLKMITSLMQIDEEMLKSVEQAPRFAEAVRRLKQELEKLAGELEARP